jgi:RNA polymerase sigma factor (sigma-70 family)
MSRYSEDKAIHLINAIINKYYRNCSIESEDVFSIAYVGYLKAMKNSNKKPSSSYIVHYVRNEVNKELRKEINYQNKMKSCEEYELIDDTKDPFDLSIFSEIHKHLYSDLRHVLSKSEYNIIKGLYFDSIPKTANELADMYGITKQRVSQVKLSAIEKIREYFDE